MAKVKQSFISNLLCDYVDRDDYDKFKGYAKKIIAIGTCVLTVILLLSFFFHSSFISSLLNLVTGTSVLFILYIATIVIALDIEVEVDVPERSDWHQTKIKPKSIAYRLTFVWGTLLIAFGIAAIYFSNQYRKHYAFECDTFLVDHQRGIYHLDWDNDCEEAAESEDLIKMKGYEIDKSYIFCDWCKDFVEDAEQVGLEIDAEDQLKR